MGAQVRLSGLFSERAPRHDLLAAPGSPWSDADIALLLVKASWKPGLVGSDRIVVPCWVVSMLAPEDRSRAVHHFAGSACTLSADLVCVGTCADPRRELTRVAGAAYAAGRLDPSAAVFQQPKEIAA